MRVLWFTQNRPEEISVGRELVGNELRDDGIDVVQRQATPRNVLRSIRDARTFDVIVGTTRAGAIGGVLLSQLARVPLVVDNLDRFTLFSRKVPWPVWRVVRALESLSFFLAAHVLFVYEEERPRVERYAREYSRTDFGVNYGDFADPTPAARSAAVDALSVLDLRENVLLYVGGLEEIYHVEELLAAMDYLDDWTLLIVGTGSKSDLVQQVAEGRDDIAFVGTVPHEHVPGYVHHADVGISLVDDARTLKVLEYMAAGLPVVHLDGEARDRYGPLLTYCSTEPSDIAGAIRRSRADARPDALRETAAANSWTAVAADYSAAIRRAARER